jgi:hypothetical protein
MKKLSKSDIPEGYKYAAVNINGKAYAFKIKPIACLAYSWRPVNDDEEFQRIEGNFDWHDWQNSLVSVED